MPSYAGLCSRAAVVPRASSPWTMRFARRVRSPAHPKECLAPWNAECRSRRDSLRDTTLRDYEITLPRMMPYGPRPRDTHPNYESQFGAVARELREQPTRITRARERSHVTEEARGRPLFGAALTSFSIPAAEPGVERTRVAYDREAAAARLRAAGAGVRGQHQAGQDRLHGHHAGVDERERLIAARVAVLSRLGGARAPEAHVDARDVVAAAEPVEESTCTWGVCHSDGRSTALVRPSRLSTCTSALHRSRLTVPSLDGATPSRSRVPRRMPSTARAPTSVRQPSLSASRPNPIGGPRACAGTSRRHSRRRALDDSRWRLAWPTQRRRGRALYAVIPDGRVWSPGTNPTTTASHHRRQRRAERLPDELPCTDE